MLNLENYYKNKQEKDIILMKTIEKLFADNNINAHVTGGTMLGAIRHKGFIPWDDDIDYAVLINDFNKVNNAMEQLEKDNNDLFYINSDGTGFNLFEPSYFGSKSEIRIVGRYIKRLNPITLNNKIDIFYMAYLSDENIVEFKKLFKEYNLLSTAIRVKTTSPIKKSAFKTIELKYNSTLKKINKFQAKISTNTSKDGKLYLWDTIKPYLRLYELPNIEETISVPFEKFEVVIPKNYHDYLEVFYKDYMKWPSEEERINVHNVSTYDDSKIVLNNESLENDDSKLEILYSNEKFAIALFENKSKFTINDNIAYDLYEYGENGMKLIIHNNAQDVTININNNNDFKFNYRFNNKKIKLNAKDNKITFKYK